MTDVLKFSKKAFTWSVVMVTVLWSVGVSAIVPLVARAAECPALEAGDLIKGANGAAVYILDANLNASYFPQSEVFHTWFKDFSGVVTLSGTCFENYPAAAHGVNYLAGTQLVKRLETPSVYAVLPGNKISKIGSPEVAAALYGSDWGKKVRDVSAFFWSNYTDTGATISTAMPHDGQLIKKASGSVYYVTGGRLKAVDGSIGILAPFVRTVSDAVFNTVPMDAASVTVASITADPTQGATSGPATPGPVVTGGDVTVSLAASSPAAADIIADSTANEYAQAQIPFVTVNFKAGSKDAVVKSVAFTRSGISSDTDLGNLYLYDGNTKVAEYSSFNDKVVTFSNASGLFTVAAGTTKALTLKGDLARGATSVSAGKKIAFQVASAAAVTTNGGTVGGSFPVQGADMTTVAVSDLGHVYLTNTSTYPSTVKADEAAKELWRFTVNADTQDMEVRYIKLSVVGTTAVSDIKNVKLEVAGTQVGAATNLNDAREAIFDLSASPIKVDAGQNKIVVVRGDMAGGSGRTFKFTIQRVTDVVTYDTEYNAFVNVSGGSTTGGFRIVQPTTGNGTSVDSGTLSIGVATDSPTGNVVDGGTNLTLAKFTFDASGENVKIDNVSVKCASNDSLLVLKNVKFLVNGSQAGTTASTLTCDNSSTNNFTFSNTFVVGMATDSVVSIVADTTDTTSANGDTVSVSLVAGSSNGQGQVTLNSISTGAATGRTLTVSSGTVTVAENTAFGDKTSSNPTGTVNASAARIASFTITAGTGEAADVSQILLADNATTALGDNFQNLKLMHGTTQIGTTISSLNTSAGTYTFTPASAIRIAAGDIYVVDVYADIKSGAADAGNPAWAAVRYGANAITATGVNTGSNISSSNSATGLQDVYIASAGNLLVTLNGDTAQTDHLVLGNTGYTLGSFDFQANASEAIRVTDVTISVSSTVGSQGTINNLSLWVDGKQVGTTVASLPTSASTATVYYNATFTNVGLTIARNTTKTVVVKADVASFDNGGDSGGVFTVAILHDVDSEKVSALGDSSGTSITGSSLDIGANSDATVVANDMTAYRTKVSVAFASDSPSGASTGSATQTVAKFVVSNSANVGSYNATIKNMNFTLSQSGISNDSTRTLNVYKDSITAGNLVATTNYTTGALNFVDSTIEESSFTDVTISAGTSKTFFVVLDTTDASTNDRLSLGIAQSGITWSDGDTSSITTVITYPSDTRTLTY